MTAPGHERPGAAASLEGAALRVSGLTRRFSGGDRAAVDGVSFDVRAGELLALVGASGSGKTTTLRIIAGFEPPDGGTVVLTGADGRSRDITTEPPRGRGFGMVFQHYALFPHMSVEQNVAFGLEARGVERADRLARARAALDRIGLGAAGTRSVQSLSGGEQQRVALARALVIEPPVLLLDEPLSNLDPTLRETTRDQLRTMLHGLNVTAIFVTHDQEDAFAIADRVAVLQRGKLLQIGTPETLYDSPATIDVARFIGRGTFLPAAVDGTTAVVTLGGVSQRVAIASDSRLTTDGTSGPPAGQLLAVIRPEMLSLAPADDGLAWRGVVAGRRFAGGHFAYTITAAAAGAPTLEVATADGSAREGESVGVRLAATAVTVVRA